MKNMRLYFGMIILKQPNKINSKEDIEEQGINLKPWIPHGMENSIQKTLPGRKLCSLMITKIG